MGKQTGSFSIFSASEELIDDGEMEAAIFNIEKINEFRSRQRFKRNRNFYRGGNTRMFTICNVNIHYRLV